MNKKSLSITLFDTATFWNNDGSRLMASLLIKAGHSIKSIFLFRDISLHYRPEELDRLDEILRDTDLVMIAVYSLYAIRAVEITEFIHSSYPGMKVIWGGPHCISAPELSLRYADGVCFAEGDRAVVDFVNRIAEGQDYTESPNMAFNINGKYVLNKVLPPTEDLDELPYPDYDISHQYYLEEDLLPMTNEKLRQYLAYPSVPPTLWALSARGCPHLCTYCNNHRYVALYGRNWMRYRSVDHVIGELEHILDKLDIFQFIGIGDDDFFMRPKKQIEEFALKYRKKFDLPFMLGLSANTYNKEKLEILLDAGLVLIGMGVQSGSQRVLDDVFGRPIKINKTKEVVAELEQYQDKRGLNVMLDFIIDNPYETGDDIIQTYKYLCDLSPKTIANIFALTFFPGTRIYERALKDGFIEPFSEKTFRSFFIPQAEISFAKSKFRYQKNYETLLILFSQHPRAKKLPRTVKSFLGSPAVRLAASLMPQSFYDVIFEKMDH